MSWLWVRNNYFWTSFENLVMIIRGFSLNIDKIFANKKEYSSYSNGHFKENVQDDIDIFLNTLRIIKWNILPLNQFNFLLQQETWSWRVSKFSNDYLSLISLLVLVKFVIFHCLLPYVSAIRFWKWTFLDQDFYHAFTMQLFENNVDQNYKT